MLTGMTRPLSLANRAASTYVGHQVRQLLKKDEDLYYSQRYNEAYALLYQLPRRARRTPLRGGSDFMRLMAFSPKALVMGSDLHADWAPWLRRFAPDLEVHRVTNPWEPGLLAVRPHFNHLDAPETLALLLRWPKRPHGLGFMADGPGRWKGQLWVGRSDNYQLSVSSGILTLDGRHRLESGKPRGFHLSSVPYELSVVGSPQVPDLTAALLEDVKQEEWAHPVVHGVPMTGLRRTLAGMGGRENGPVRQNMMPVVAQRFSIWSYEPDETTLRFPWQGWWEGWLKVPEDGVYRFVPSNNFSGGIEMQVDGLAAYVRKAGEAFEAHPLALKAGREYPVSIHAFRIDADQAMHLEVQWAEGDLQAVPSEWLRPAPLPAPVPISVGRP
jgi:hypothetical protein